MIHLPTLILSGAVYYPDCNYTWGGTDANGDSYNPDETLIMSYTHPNCMSQFTAKQGQRMRNAISTLPFLQDVIVCTNTYLLSNRTITTDETINDCKIKVTNVTVQNNSDLILDAYKDVEITSNFEVKSGSTLEIK